VRSGSSYASQSDLALTFGLGSDKAVSSVDVEWPSGIKDRAASIAAGHVVTIEEGRGVVRSGGRNSK
jgi:phosphohistidine swiveling domain-containing protein